MPRRPSGLRLLDPIELAKLASLTVRARVVVEGAFAGLHHNPHAGSSIEFAEHKEYAPGDDIRHIDWKAVARVDRYYIKRFEDETEMRTYLLRRCVGVDGLPAQRACPSWTTPATWRRRWRTCWRSRAIPRG